MTQQELFSAVRAETHRATIADPLLATFLLAVEAKIARDVRASEQTAQTDVTFTDDVATLPDDFLQARSLSNDAGPIRQVGLFEYHEQIRERCYALSGNTALGRMIDGPARLVYFRRMPTLATSGDTHALIAAHPDLYVSLLAFHVYKWSQDLELAQGMLDVYNDAAEQVNALATQSMGGARIRRGYNFGTSRGGY